MKTTNGLLAVVASVLLIASCSFGKKKEKTSDCEGCPEPVSIDVPAELAANQNAKLYIKDAETMFNKWSKRAFLLTKDLEKLEDMDTSAMTLSESIKAGSTALKMVGYMGEFMSESLAMSQRMEELEQTFTEEEKIAFKDVMSQFESRMEEISASLNELGIDAPSNSQDMVNALEGLENEK